MSGPADQLQLPGVAVGVADGVVLGVGLGPPPTKLNLPMRWCQLRAVHSEIFVNVPETHVIRGIDAEVAVIAPARAARLRAGTVEHVSLRPGQDCRVDHQQDARHNEYPGTMELLETE